MARKQSLTSSPSSPPPSSSSAHHHAPRLLAKFFARRRLSKVRRAAAEANLKLLKFNRVKSQAPRFSRSKVHTPIFSCVVSTKQFIYGFYQLTAPKPPAAAPNIREIVVSSSSSHGQLNHHFSFSSFTPEEEEEMAGGLNRFAGGLCITSPLPPESCSPPACSVGVARYCKVSGHWNNRLAGLTGDLPVEWDSPPLFSLLLGRLQAVLLFFSSALYLFCLRRRRFTALPVEAIFALQRAELGLGLGLGGQGPLTVDYSVELFCAALDPEERWLYVQAGLTVTPVLMMMGAGQAAAAAAENGAEEEEVVDVVLPPPPPPPPPARAFPRGGNGGNGGQHHLAADPMIPGAPETRVGVFRLSLGEVENLDDGGQLRWERLPLHNDTFGEVMPEGLFMAFQEGGQLTGDSSSPAGDEEGGSHHLFMMIRDLRTRFWVPSVDARFSCQTSIIHVDLLAGEWTIEELKIPPLPPPLPLELSQPPPPPPKAQAASAKQRSHGNRGGGGRGSIHHHHHHHQGRRRSTHERISVASEGQVEAEEAEEEADQEMVEHDAEAAAAVRPQYDRKDLMLKFKTAVSCAFVRPSSLFILGCRDFWRPKTSLWSIDLRTRQWRCLVHKARLRPRAAKAFLLTATGDAEDGLWAVMNYSSSGSSYRRRRADHRHFTAYYVPLEMPRLTAMSRAVLMATLRAEGGPLSAEKVEKAKRKEGGGGEKGGGGDLLSRLGARVRRFIEARMDLVDFVTEESVARRLAQHRHQRGATAYVGVPLPASPSVDQQLAEWMGGLRIEGHVLGLPPRREV